MPRIEVANRAPGSTGLETRLVDQLVERATHVGTGAVRREAIRVLSGSSCDPGAAAAFACDSGAAGVATLPTAACDPGAAGGKVGKILVFACDSGAADASRGYTVRIAPKSLPAPGDHNVPPQHLRGARLPGAVLGVERRVPHDSIDNTGANRSPVNMRHVSC